ncbi:MAG: hypothetical protein HY200_00155 [Nitrospirae bacterium]|nr:hypothetical protein [Nitrospirota bacterium]MBI3593349.1 hypothetical protein [Nitrospirota bacterium]
MSQVIGLSRETVTISIMGKSYQVAKDKLLYVFQDLDLLRARNKFCWNGECKNCTISFSTSSDPAVIITERACQTTASEGLRVVEMPEAFYLAK